MYEATHTAAQQAAAVIRGPGEGYETWTGIPGGAFMGRLYLPACHSATARLLQFAGPACLPAHLLQFAGRACPPAGL